MREAINEYVTLEWRRSIALIWMHREPVNSADQKLWAGLAGALERAEADPNTRGLVIGSGIKKDVFMAGNDLTELYVPKTTRDRYAVFWMTLSRFLARLHASRLVTAVAARGYCPAGGTAVLLCCDVRVISGGSDRLTYKLTQVLGDTRAAGKEGVRDWCKLASKIARERDREGISSILTILQISRAADSTKWPSESRCPDFGCNCSRESSDRPVQRRCVSAGR